MTTILLIALFILIILAMLEAKMYFLPLKN